MANITKFYGEVKTEMKKVAWPSKQDLISSTIVVLISTAMLSLYIGICDMFLARFINLLISGVFR
ncbi:MAG: preprotein translocase subunit SecE [Candidatus Omnitrophota bacterium]